MATGLSHSQVESWNELTEAGRRSAEELRSLAREANQLADRLGTLVGRLGNLSASGSSAEAPPGRAGTERVALPLLLEFTEQCRELRHRHELPSLLANSASQLAPRVLLFARSGDELVGWDCFVRGRRSQPELRGARLSLAELQDLAETLDRGEVFSYAGHLEPFYRQLPDEASTREVGATCFVPLRVAEQCVGVLCADAPGAGEAIDELPLQLLARQAGLAMELLLRSATPAAAAPPVELAAPATAAAAAPLAEPAVSELETAVSAQPTAPEAASSEPWLLDESTTTLPPAAALDAELPDSVLVEDSAAASILHPEGYTSDESDFILPEAAAASSIVVEETPGVRAADPEKTTEWSVADFLAAEAKSQAEGILPAEPADAATAAAPAEPADELIWDIDEAFGGVGSSSSSGDGEFGGFHIDTPTSADAALDALFKAQSEIEETEDERTARKLARVIVQDIILYNRQKIDQGKARGNLGDPLADDIHRGGQHFKAKVAAALYPKRYFYNALLEILAEGRAELLRTLKIDF